MNHAPLQVRRIGVADLRFVPTPGHLEYVSVDDAHLYVADACMKYSDFADQFIDEWIAATAALLDEFTPRFLQATDERVNVAAELAVAAAQLVNAADMFSHRRGDADRIAIDVLEVISELLADRPSPAR